MWMRRDSEKVSSETLLFSYLLRGKAYFRGASWKNVARWSDDARERMPSKSSSR